VKMRLDSRIDKSGKVLVLREGVLTDPTRGGGEGVEREARRIPSGQAMAKVCREQLSGWYRGSPKP
jgi:hypothetical protein